MAPLPIALDPGRCPGFTRINGTKCGICITCGCRKDARHTLEPAAAFVDGIWQCVNWRGHGAANVARSGETRISHSQQGVCASSSAGAGFAR